ncbi:MAG: TatA/E family twin arginine-targeting protein translocase [Prochloraceae cyanobacterium]|nr:TatA/E family twin arginine-targeting protein translocase [Prochloraceae cyanobacterium]
MNIFGVGLPEMLLILGIALLIFGPKKLPEIGRSLGKAIKGFQDAAKDFETEFNKETSEPTKNNPQLEEPKQIQQVPNKDLASKDSDLAENKS